MIPKRSDEVLSEWSAVTKTATPPGAPPRSSTASVAGPGFSLAGVVVLVVAVVAAMAWLGNRDGTQTGAAASPTPAPSFAIVIPPATPTPPPVGTPTPSRSPAPSATTSSTSADCDTTKLAARITLWEGAAGSRIAHVQLSNNGSSPCTIPSVSRVRLVDGAATELIVGAPPSGSGTITIPAGGTATTLVEASNYCGPTPVPGGGIGFDIDGVDTVFASGPATDMSVPPCNGPGQPGSIQMQPWSGG